MIAIAKYIWKDSDLGLQVGMKLEGMKIVDINLFA